MKYFFLFLFLVCGKAWGWDSFSSSAPALGSPVPLFAPMPFYVHVQTTAPTIYEVTMASETWTLDYFVSSGKFCEWRKKHEFEKFLGERQRLFRCRLCGYEYWEP